MIEKASAMLLGAQNADGGWGAVAGRGSNTEATALALLALHAVKLDPQSGPILRATTWLIEKQNSDGSWPLSDSSKIPSWSSAFAVLALGWSPEHLQRAVRGASWLLAQTGSKPGILAKLVLAVTFQKRVVQLNDDLVGWSWTAGSFSWVEPTSYCLMALKKLRPQLSGTEVGERIDQGELMIYDRMCEGGGWNYGNTAVFGEKLWPYPDVTAVALIALQDRADRKENQLSLRLLKKLAQQADSGLALSWALICLSLYGEETAQWKQSLARSFAKGAFLGEVKPLALAILAWTDDKRFFRV